MLGAASVGDGQVHPRLEIRELEKNADQWNIYLLGLRRFQNADQRDKLSYYQIAGMLYYMGLLIHFSSNPLRRFSKDGSGSLCS